MLGFTLGLPLGIMYLTIKAYQVVTDKYVARNRIIIVLGIIGVALLAAQVVPPRAWDLYQHYDEINRIREWVVHPVPRPTVLGVPLPCCGSALAPHP